MAVGVSKTLWSMDDVVKMVEAWEAEPTEPPEDREPAECGAQEGAARWIA
jgi:hypothetical protein